MLAVGQRRADQVVALVQVDRDDAGLARVAELVERRLLHRAQRGRHEDVVVGGEAAELAGQRQHHGDLLARLQREHVDDRLAAAGASALRHLPDLQPVDAAAVAEAQHPVVRVGDEELVDPVVFLGLRGLLAAAAALLRAVLGQRLALDVAAVAERDHHVGRGDQVLGAQLLHVVLDGGAARAQLRLAELGAQRAQLVDDDRGDPLGTRQDVEQVGDGRHDVAVLADDLVLLQAGQALQAHLQDLAGLVVGQAVEAVGLQAVLRRQPLGAEGLAAAQRGAARALEHLAHQRRVPALLHQRGARHRRRGRGLDDADELVDVGQRHRQALEHMPALARLAQLVHRAARHHLAAVLQEDLQQELQVAQARLTVDQRDHVHAEAVLQLRLLVEVVEHDLGHFAALELDDHAHAGLVRLVLDVADALDLLLVDELGDALEQRLLVHLIGNLVDDDRLARAAVDVLEMHPRAHDNAPATGAVALAHAGHAVDDAGGGEVRRRDDLHQLVDGGVGLAQQVQTGVDHLVEVVRRDVGGHAHRDAGRAVDQQVGQPGRQHQRLALAAVVVRAEVDGLLVDVGQHLVRDLAQADLGVAHRRGVVAVDRTEIALAVDQHVAQREVLRHAHDGVVDRGVAVRMVFADHVADDARALLVGAVPVVVELVHRVEHAPVHRLQTVACIRQRPPDDHAHRVVEVGAAHFLFEADGQGFFGELSHAVGPLHSRDAHKSTAAPGHRTRHSTIRAMSSSRNSPVPGRLPVAQGGKPHMAQ